MGRLLNAFIARNAARDAEGINIRDAFSGGSVATKFPAGDDFVVVCQYQFDEGEEQVGHTFGVEVKVVEGPQPQIFQAGVNDIPPGAIHPTAVLEPINLWIGVRLITPAPGKYLLVLLIDGNPAVELPWRLAQGGEAPDDVSSLLL